MRFQIVLVIASLLLPVSFLTHGSAMEAPLKAAFERGGDEVESVEPFELVDIHGKQLTVTESADSRLTLVVFLGTECPLAKFYSKEIQRISDEYSDRGVQVIGLDSNVQDSENELKSFAVTQKLTFPLAKDVDNVIADQFQAERTPEVFVLDQSLKIRYRGRIDDQYLPGVARPKPTRTELQDALRELLAGKIVSVPRTKPQGCLIGRAKKTNSSASDVATVTFSNQVSRVLKKHCVECHRAGEIGPFSVVDFSDVAGWAEMIVEVVDEGRMPPWHASPDHVALANSRFMPESDKQILRDWLASGAPLGDENQLPKQIQYPSGWRLPQKPDMVIEMGSAFEVPEDGTVEYQYFVVDPGFEKDMWISAAEVIPGNQSVVHHSIVFIRPPDGGGFRGSGWLGAYVPGQGHMQFDPGHARLIPAGSKLVFQQHYTPNGTAQSDRTKVGMVFIDKDEVTHEIMTLVGIEQGFEIPPHDANFRVELSVPYIPTSGKLLSVSPHMHWRGKSFELFSVNEGDRKQLLEVPKYDFNWQHSYRFQEPIDLENIEKLEFAVAFDNSKQNPANPDPTEYVMWGDQTWEEMAVAFFEVSRPLKKEASQQAVKSDESVSQASQTVEKEISDEQRRRQVKVTEKTDEFFAKYDANGDDVVVYSELPKFLWYGSWQFDNDGDGSVTRLEVEAYVRRTIRLKDK